MYGSYQTLDFIPYLTLSTQYPNFISLTCFILSCAAGCVFTYFFENFLLYHNEWYHQYRLPVKIFTCYRLVNFSSQYFDVTRKLLGPSKQPNPNKRGDDNGGKHNIRKFSTNLSRYVSYHAFPTVLLG